MATDHILLVERDAKTRRLLEVSLEQAGYSVDTVRDGSAALEFLDGTIPDLALVATELPKLDGYGLVRKMKDDEEWRAIPVVFLIASDSIEDKIRGLELGVDEYVTKPVFVKELLSRVQVLLAKRVRARLSTSVHPTRVAGRIEDLPCIDLFESLESGRQSGTIRLRSGEREATVFFQDGEIIDARLRRLRGEEVVYRLLSWSRGVYEVDLDEITVEPIIDVSTRALIEAGMRHASEYHRLLEELPPLGTIFQVNRGTLAQYRQEIPDEIDGILELFNGRRTLLDVIDESPFDDLSTLTTIAKLFDEELLSVVAQGPTALDRSATPLAPEPESGELHLDDDGAITMRPPSVRSMSPLSIDAARIGEAAARAVAQPFVPTEMESDRVAASDPVEDESPLPDSALRGHEVGTEASFLDEAEPSIAPEEPAPTTPRRGGIRPSSPGDDEESPAVPASTAIDEDARPTVALDDAAATTEDARPTMSVPSPRPGRYPTPAGGTPSFRGGEAVAAAGAGRDEYDDEDSGEFDSGEYDDEDSGEFDDDEDSGEFDSGEYDDEDSGEYDDDEDSGEFDSGEYDDDEDSGEYDDDEDSGEFDSGEYDDEDSDGDAAGSIEGSAHEALARVEAIAAPFGGDGAEPSEPAPESSPVLEEDGHASAPVSSGPPSSLSSSDASRAFFAGPHEDEDDDLPPPSSAREVVELTDAQLDRRDGIRKVVMVVVGILAGLIIVVAVRGSGRSSSDSTPPIPASPPSSASEDPTSAPSAAAAPLAAGGGGSAGENGGAGGAGDGGAGGAAEGEGGAAEGEGGALPDVENPLQEAKRLVNAGASKDAIPMAKAAIAKDPDAGDAYFWLGMALMETGKRAEAKAAFKACVDKGNSPNQNWCSQYAAMP